MHGQMAGDLDNEVEPPRLRVLGVEVTPMRRLAFFVTVDSVLIVAAIALAVILRYGTIPARPQVADLPLVTALFLTLTVAILHLLGVYRAAWSFMGLRDVARLAAAVAISTFLVGFLVQLAHWNQAPPLFPRSAIIIQAPITFCALASFRLSRRAYSVISGRRQIERGSPTLLVGAGDAGAQVLRSIQASRAPYDVRAFLDDDPLAKGTLIHGVRILGPVSTLEHHVAREHIETVIISVASATSALVQDVVRRCKSANVKVVRIVPSLAELVGGNVSINMTRDVKLEDLLGREAVSIDANEVRDLLHGRRVLVTGGAGTIGSELCKQIARFAPSQLTIVDLDETRLHDAALDLREAHAEILIKEALVDVRDARSLRELFAQDRPDIVFHAAAYKHVPMMELFPLAALETNVLGTLNAMQAAAHAGARRFVLISTDKAVEPSSLMGASKRLAELVLFTHPQRGDLTCSAVRFGNVIGSRGSLIPTFERQLARGGPLTVTHPDIERYFMMTSEAVSLVLQAATMGEGRDVFILDMGRPVRILDVAREFIRLHGMEPERDIAIRITGLRPGEKMSEKLHYDDELLTPTTHARIMRADVHVASDAKAIVSEVEDLIEKGDAEEARAYLKRLFPTLGAASVATVTNRR